MKKFFSVFNVVIIVLLIIILPFFIFKTPSFYLDLSAKKQEMKIIEVWHCETFEGGSQSRLALLKKVAKEYETQNPNYSFYIRKVVPDQLLSLLALSKPDILSFGYGIDSSLIQYLCELSAENNVQDKYLDSVRIGGKIFALPYLLNCYVLCSENEILTTDLNNEENIFVGNEGYATPTNLINNIAKEKLNNGETISSYEAYCKFRKESKTKLLGTMRDVARLTNVTYKTNLSYYYEPMNYTNLLQYVSICDTKNYGIAQDFISILLSDKYQNDMNKYGLFSTTKSNIYTTEIYNYIETKLENLEIEKIW